MSNLTQPIRLLRSITSELRQALPAGTNIHQSQPMGYILSQYKKNMVTQEQLCKHQQEMIFMAETYLTYLSKSQHCMMIKLSFHLLGSQRQWYDVQQEYHAKGERTVSQTAKMVGFNLPHEPKVERRGAPKKD